MSDVTRRLRIVLDSMGQGDTTVDFVSVRSAISDAIEDLEELNTLRAEVGKEDNLRRSLAKCADEKQELIAALEACWLERDAAEKKVRELTAQITAFSRNV